jgi:hypothetical protein
MNALNLQRELELAAWEMAESERHEKTAKALRLSASKRIAASHLELEIAIKEAQSRKEITKEQKPKPRKNAGF